MTTQLTLEITRTRAGKDERLVIEEPLEKLRWRGSLPGASVWDRNAHVLRALQANGVEASALLSLAMPSSWMVNAKASSILMQRWLAKPAVEAWIHLLDVLEYSMSAEEWRELSEEKRRSLVDALGVLVVGHEKDGASLVAVTKVLALLRPQLVPLMDDAALWFALDLVPEPATADAPTAKVTAFLPMLDWFVRETSAHEDELVALAAAHDLAVLDGPQVLDRLLWVESWGERSRRRAKSTT